MICGIYQRLKLAYSEYLKIKGFWFIGLSLLQTSSLLFFEAKTHTVSAHVPLAAWHGIMSAAHSGTLLYHGILPRFRHFLESRVLLFEDLLRFSKNVVGFLTVTRSP